MESRMEGDKIVVKFDMGEYDKDLLDFLSYYEILKKSKATQEDIDKLSEEVSRNWWEKNKHRFINEDNS
jgi:hypothetical protein